MTEGSYGRRDRLIKEKRHDAYEGKGKLPEPTICRECNALFMDGRWSWKETKESANGVVCPACKRIADHYPAGHVVLRGQFFIEKRDEILSLVRNVEKQEKSTPPLIGANRFSHRRDGSLSDNHNGNPYRPSNR